MEDRVQWAIKKKKWDGGTDCTGQWEMELEGEMLERENSHHSPRTALCGLLSRPVPQPISFKLTTTVSEGESILPILQRRKPRLGEI